MVKKVTWTSDIRMVFPWNPTFIYYGATGNEEEMQKKIRSTHHGKQHARCACRQPCGVHVSLPLAKNLTCFGMRQTVFCNHFFNKNHLLQLVAAKPSL